MQWKLVSVLDFKYTPCSECRIVSFGLFPVVLILCADFSEQTVSSIFVGGVCWKNNRDEIIMVFTREKIWLEISLGQSE